MPMLTGNGESPQFYGQWTVEDSQNWLLATCKFNKTKKSISLDSRFVNLENTGLCATLRMDQLAQSSFEAIVQLPSTVLLKYYNDNMTYTQIPMFVKHVTTVTYKNDDISSDNLTQIG